MRNYFYLILSVICLGTAMPLYASQAHPDGPKEEGFVERTIRIYGQERYIAVTFAHPKPNDIVDHTVNNEFNAQSKRVPLMLDFEYKGYFWQGVFGRVGFDVKVYKRKPDDQPWTNLAALFQSVDKYYRADVIKVQNENPDIRQAWMEPFMSELNGVTCVQQYMAKGKREKDRRVIYFLLDEDHALMLSLELVDNSDRPGLTASDWRPRAESFANRLLSTVKVQVMPNQ